MLGLNVGVKTGQLAIVAVFFAICQLAEKQNVLLRRYIRRRLNFASAVALVWLTERAFN